VLGPLGLVGVDAQASIRRRTRLDLLLALDAHEVVVAAAVGDQVGDGADLEPVRWAKATSSGRRAMVPSSFITSQITPEG
jgi:hypothetical protein